MKIKDFLPLYAVIFLGFLGFALTITLFIPMLMDKHYLLLSADSSTSLRMSISGLLLAMYPLGQFLGSPIIGGLSDHYGRKKVLCLSLLVCAVGFMLMAISIDKHQLYGLLLSAFLTGLCESNMAISQSVIADRVTDTIQKAKYIGYAYSACSLGYIVGPLLGGSLGTTLGYSSAFWVTAIGTAVLALWVYWAFADNKVAEHKTPLKLLKALTAMSSLFKARKLYKFYIINFMIFFAVQGLYRVVPLYVMDTWQPSLHVYSLLIAFSSLICLLVNLFLLGKLARLISIKVLLATLLLVGGVITLIIVLPENFNWIWLTFGLVAIPTVMALPTCTTWLSQQADEASQGQVLGNNQALLVLGEAASASLGGLLAAILVPLPVITMGIILIVAGLWVTRL